MRRTRKGSLPFAVSGYVVSAIYVFVIVVPIYFVVLASFKTNAQIFGAPLGFPKAPNFANFRLAIESAGLVRAFLFSVMVTVVSEFLTLVLAYPAAYGIARIRIRASSWLLSFFSVGFLIPTLPLLLSTYLLAARWGLLYNPLMLMLFYPATRIPFTILFLTPFIRAVPDSLEESAQIDGASRLQIIRMVFLPLTRGGIVNVLILNFITYWNEYIFALVLLDSFHRTLQVAIASLSANSFDLQYGVIAAGLVLASLPVFIVFFIFQERVMTGILAGALKE